MFATSRNGFTLLELLAAIAIVAVAFTIALPAIPSSELCEPIDDVGPVDIKAFRLEFASAGDPVAVETELRAMLPEDDSTQLGLCEVVMRDVEPNVVYVGLWAPVTMKFDDVAQVFEGLGNAPIGVSSVNPE